MRLKSSPHGESIDVKPQRNPTAIQVVIDCRRRLLSFAYGKLRDTELAEDLVQDTLATALAAVQGNRIRELHNLEGYVFGVARRLVLRAHRNRVRRNSDTSLDDLTGWGLAALSELSPEDSVVRNEHLRLAQRALEALAPREKDLLETLCQRTDTLADTAVEWGISHSALRQRKSRAVKHLTVLVEGLLLPNRSGGDA